MAVTVETSPAFIQANSYSAEQTRRGTFGFQLERGATVGSVAGGLVGWNPGASVPDLQVTYSNTGLTVNIAAGEVVVPGSSSATQSGYPLRVTTSGSLTPTTADPSNPRIDLIYAQVEDQAYTGSSNLGQVAIATGTPTSGATLTNLTGAPAVPTSSIAIAYVLIPAGASTISNTDILNEYTMVYFGPNIFNARPVSGTTTVNAKSGDHIIVSSGNTPITLPAPFKNARVKVTNYGSGTVTVSHNSSEVIYSPQNGSSGGSSVTVGPLGPSLTLESDGTNWFQTSVSTTAGTGNGAVVSTGQSTTSGSFTDLSTVGPVVTLTTNTLVKVTVTAALHNSITGDAALMGFAISGATTASAIAANALQAISAVGGTDELMSASFVVTVTAGSNTFTAKYATAGAGTANFADRNVIVECLN